MTRDADLLAALEGGLSEHADDKEFDPNQLRMGIEVESIHTKHKAVAKRLAMDHLAEMPEYYTWYRAMELLAEKQGAKKVRRTRRARKNPEEIKLVPKLIGRTWDKGKAKKVRNFLAQAYHEDRFQNEPDALRATMRKRMVEVNAAYESENAAALDRLLAPFLARQVGLPPGWVLELPSVAAGPARLAPAAETAPSDAYRRAIPHQQERREILQRAAKSALHKAIGPKFSELIRNMRAEALIQNTVGLWIEGVGARFLVPGPLDRFGNRGSSVLGDFGVTREDVQSKSLEFKAFVETFTPYAREVRNSLRDELEREVGPGAYEADAPADTSPEGQPDNYSDLREEAAAEADLMDFVRAVLPKIATRPGGKLRHLTLSLHLGLPTIQGLPEGLRGNQPYKDFLTRHPGGQECPTCGRIFRFLRIRGLTKNEVPNIVDETVQLIIREYRSA